MQSDREDGGARAKPITLEVYDLSITHQDMIFKWHFSYIGFNRECHEI